MINHPNNLKVKPGDRLRADKYNRLVDIAHRQMIGPGAIDLLTGYAVRPSWAPKVNIRALVVTEGPPLEEEGEPQEDFTDHRYWVKFGRCTNEVATDPMLVENEEGDVVVMATNIAEQFGETHYLRDGQMVDIWPETDESGVPRYYMVHPP